MGCGRFIMRRVIGAGGVTVRRVRAVMNSVVRCGVVAGRMPAGAVAVMRLAVVMLGAGVVRGVFRGVLGGVFAMGVAMFAALLVSMFGGGILVAVLVLVLALGAGIISLGALILCGGVMAVTAAMLGGFCLFFIRFGCGLGVGMMVVAGLRGRGPNSQRRQRDQRGQCDPLHVVSCSVRGRIAGARFGRID